MNWRPMRTAYKDGTYLLLCDQRSGVMAVAAWTSSEEDYDGAPIFGWSTVDGISYMTLSWTHWMPLPPLPTETQ